jgi:hypothetical protein
MSSATADSDVMLALIRARCWLCRKSIDIDSLLASKNRTFSRACGNIQQLAGSRLGSGIFDKQELPHRSVRSP